MGSLFSTKLKANNNKIIVLLSCRNVFLPHPINFDQTNTGKLENVAKSVKENISLKKYTSFKIHYFKYLPPRFSSIECQRELLDQVLLPNPILLSY